MKKLLVFSFVALVFFGQLFAGTEVEKRKEKILAHEARPAGAEALARKDRSIAVLKEKGVPTMAGLPVIEDSKTAKVRNTREIAGRLLGCTIAAVGGETGDRKLVQQLIADFSAASLLTPDEQKFLTEQLEDRRQKIQFSWHYERAWVLLWALGYIERLEYPTAQCDVPFLAQFLHGKSVERLVADAKPRALSEILDEADLIYRLHWAIVDERVNPKTKVPVEIEKGVVMERHHALNWLIGYLGQDWDDVTTDT